MTIFKVNSCLLNSLQWISFQLTPVQGKVSKIQRKKVGSQSSKKSRRTRLNVHKILIFFEQRNSVRKNNYHHYIGKHFSQSAFTCANIPPPHFATLVSGLFWCFSSKELSCQCRRCGYDAWVRKIPWRRKRQTHSNILAWEIPRTEEPGKLQSMGPQRVGHNLVTKQQLC